MTRKELAVKLSLHESTISRIIANKYVQTDKGTFPLKTFFSQRVGAHVSSQYIKIEIEVIMKELQEIQQKITDNIIVAHLEKRGITIARRTVSKYRKEIVSKQE